MAEHDDSCEPDEVTRRLNARGGASGEAGGDLPSLVYHQLKQMAHRQLRRESGEPTLSTTALVHEAWLQIGDSGIWQARGHFYRYAGMLGLDHALEDLARDYPQLAEVVELRFFAGLSVADTAQVLGISERSVVRGWRRARAMIHRILERDHVA